jgi:hypothetical protein
VTELSPKRRVIRILYLVNRNLPRLIIGKDTSCVHLPSLKTLNLKPVYFQNLNLLISFLFSCPNIEDFHVEPVSYKRPLNPPSITFLG